MRQVTWRDRLSYRFDNIMARGPMPLIGLLLAAWLSFVTLIAVVGVLLGVTPEGGDPLRLGEALWINLLRTLDPGTMGDDAGWGFRVSSLAVTLGGVVLISTFIGVVISGIERRLENLRKGRSIVVERGHTLILGWSPQVFSILRELAAANANHPGATVVILADRDKVEMEDAIRTQVPALRGTRVVCRTGSPIDMADLEIANPHDARAVIIPAPDAADPDAHVIKTLLALTNNPHRRRDPHHIVAAVREPSNAAVARMVGRDEVQLVLAGDLIARIAVQTCRQSGLSTVYTELLDFDGDEIYFVEEPRLAGVSFGDALLRYEDSAPIGLRLADGRVLVKPPMDQVIAAGDRIVAISRDDDTVTLAPAPLAPDESAIRAPQPRALVPERTLILGWNRRAPLIVQQLDAYVPHGSSVTIVTDAPAAAASVGERRDGLERLTPEVHAGDTVDRATLERFLRDRFDHVIVLGDSDRLEAQEADARTLITLLHLRDIVERERLSCAIVGEMLDVRNRELAEVTKADDFIVSDRLVSLMLSQISQHRDLAAVFADLFDPEGVELYLRPAGDYVVTGIPVTFYTVVESARRRGEIAVGYRVKAEAADRARAHGVHVNPPKRNPVAFTDADRIIVLAEE